jgi:hypothetical protein
MITCSIIVITSCLSSCDNKANLPISIYESVSPVSNENGMLGDDVFDCTDPLPRTLSNNWSNLGPSSELPIQIRETFSM